MPALTRDEFERRSAAWRRRSWRAFLIPAGFLVFTLAWVAVPRWLAWDPPRAVSYVYSLLFLAGVYATVRLFFGDLERGFARSGLTCPSCADSLLGRDYGATVRSTGRCPACGETAVAG